MDNIKVRAGKLRCCNTGKGKSTYKRVSDNIDSWIISFVEMICAIFSILEMLSWIEELVYYWLNFYIFFIFFMP